MTWTQEIAYSAHFICPSQSSVDQLKKAQTDEETRRLFGDANLSQFTILTVPDRVVEILSSLSVETYGDIATWKITPLWIIQMAQERCAREKQQPNTVFKSGWEILPKAA